MISTYNIRHVKTIALVSGFITEERVLKIVRLTVTSGNDCHQRDEGICDALFRCPKAFQRLWFESQDRPAQNLGSCWLEVYGVTKCRSTSDLSEMTLQEHGTQSRDVTHRAHEYPRRQLTCMTHCNIFSLNLTLCLCLYVLCPSVRSLRMLLSGPQQTIDTHALMHTLTPECSWSGMGDTRCWF